MILTSKLFRLSFKVVASSLVVKPVISTCQALHMWEGLTTSNSNETDMFVTDSKILVIKTVWTTVV